jgi:hypothetical protein
MLIDAYGKYFLSVLGILFRESLVVDVRRHSLLNPIRMTIRQSKARLKMVGSFQARYSSTLRNSARSNPRWKTMSATRPESDCGSHFANTFL